MIDKSQNNDYNTRKMKILLKIKENILELAKTYDANIKLEFDVNPKQQSIKTKVTQYL